MTSTKEDISAKVKERVEFFFSDSNFMRDKFLKQKARENKERYVDISILLKFNTLKALTTDEKVVAEAVKDSEVVEVNDSGSAIRRKSAEMPDERNINKRRVFVDGLPQDTKWTEVRDVFQTFGKVGYVQLRRDRLTRKALGSATVDFESEDAAKKAVESPPTFRDEKLKSVIAFTAWLDSRKSKHRKSPKDRKRRDREELNTDVLVLRVKGLSEDDVRSNFRDIKNSLVSLTEKLEESDVKPKFVDISDSIVFVRCQCTVKEGTSFVEKVKKEESLTILEKSVQIDAADEKERETYFARMRQSAKERDDRERGQKRRRHRDRRDDTPKKKQKQEEEKPTTTEAAAVSEE
eukprot:g3030.t1